MPTLAEIGALVKASAPDDSAYAAADPVALGRLWMQKYGGKLPPAPLADQMQPAHESTATEPTPEPWQAHMLPMAGSLGLGAVGSLIGPEGTAGGYVAGGMAGKAIENAIAMRGGNPSASPADVALEGVKQGAINVTGEHVISPIASAVLNGMGQKAMQLALRVTPEVAQTAIKNGVRATSGSVKQMLDRIGQATDVTGKISAIAARLGVRYAARDIDQSVTQPLLDKFTGLPGDDPMRAKVQQLSHDFLGEHPGGYDARPISPMRSTKGPLAGKRFVGRGPVGTYKEGSIPADKLHDLKMRADKMLQDIHHQVALGNRPAMDAEEQWLMGFAAKSRELLGGKLTATGERAGGIPGFAAADAATQRLIQVKDALQPVVKANPSLLGAIAEKAAVPASSAALGAGAGYALDRPHPLQGALAGGAAGGLLGTPQGLAAIALLLSNPHLAELLGQGVARGGAAMMPSH